MHAKRKEKFTLNKSSRKNTKMDLKLKQRMQANNLKKIVLIQR